MDFKIDTKDTFTIIVPMEAQISANMTDELLRTCTDIGQNGSNNFIIDMQHAHSIDTAAISGLVILHGHCYGQGQSLVLTAMATPVLAALKSTEMDLLLNITPTMDEAIDIVSMEILERELLSEE